VTPWSLVHVLRHSGGTQHMLQLQRFGTLSARISTKTRAMLTEGPRDSPQRSHCPLRTYNAHAQLPAKWRQSTRIRLRPNAFQYHLTLCSIVHWSSTWDTRISGGTRNISRQSKRNTGIAWAFNRLWSSHSRRFVPELRRWHARSKLSQLVNRPEPH
jgi:hypothetical protein